jgi:hypothetical protein
MISACLLLSLSVIMSYPISIIPDVEGESQTDQVGINSTTYENSTLGIRIEHPTNWKPFEKTSVATSADVIEFIPFVESEHDPLTPFFSISIEDLEKVKVSQKVGNESVLGTRINNNSAIEILTNRNLELAKSLPDFNLTEFNRTSILSGIPAYKIVYTFADPGSPLLPLFKSMNLWTVKDGKAYTISYSASESEFSNHLETIQNMIDSFTIGKK